MAVLTKTSAASRITNVQMWGAGHWETTGTPMSRNSLSASMAVASLQRQAVMSGDPQSTTAPSRLTGMRARPSASRATPPQRAAGSASATGSLAAGGDGADSFGSFSHALRKPWL